MVVRRNDDFGSERAFRADETLVSEIDQNVLRSAKLKTMFFSKAEKSSKRRIQFDEFDLSSNTPATSLRATAADLQCFAHSAAVLFVIQTRHARCFGLATDVIQICDKI